MIFLQFCYNLFFPIVFVIILPSYLPRMFRRGSYGLQFFQRLGIFDSTTRTHLGTGRIWVHAVSVGEILIALKWIRCWKEKHPEAHFILSTTTTTALAIAKKQASDWLEPIANPIDFFWISNSFINRFAPSALIMVEGDVWPQRLFYCQKKNIPTAIVTARLSPRSERRLKRFRWIIGPFFNLFNLITLPSAKDQQRWISLGVNPALLKITGNMKYDQQGVSLAEPPKDVDAIFENLGWEKNDLIFLAGSTDNLEEEEILVKAWLALKKKIPQLRFIIAPRYVERRQELVSFFEKQHISTILRSKQPTGHAEVLILDTTGELNSWYMMATLVFVGKSLGVGTAHGGHNPVEPLVLRRPVLVGPSMENFEPLISELLQARGVTEVSSEEEIIRVAERFLVSPEEAAASVERGLQALKKHQGSMDRTCDLLEQLFLGIRSLHRPTLL
jgi:3-deoxy-D-manno-octulosonic-acid transferase